MDDVDVLKSMLAKVDSETLKRLIIEVAEDKAATSITSGGYNRGSKSYNRTIGGYDRIHNRHNR